MKQNFRHPELKPSDGSRNFELDIFFPKLKLAFEYQGEHHYSRLNGFVTNLERRQERDVEKKQKCHEMGITLVMIPYWWDKQISTLKATIHNKKTGLVDDVPFGVSPIPEINPLPNQDGVTTIQGIFEIVFFYLNSTQSIVTLTYSPLKLGQLMHPREMNKNDWHKVQGMYVTEK
jgi:hypothetical protein